jgi:hypothetical protein
VTRRRWQLAPTDVDELLDVLRANMSTPFSADMNTKSAGQRSRRAAVSASASKWPSVEAPRTPPRAPPAL